MEKQISHRKFMRAMWRGAKADLIVSKYNKQEAKKMIEQGVVCECPKPLTYGVLSKKCYRCNLPLKKN